MSSELVDKIVRIVDYNTDNTVQSETIPIEALMGSHVSHNNIDPEKARSAINQALEEGRLKEVDGELTVPNEHRSQVRTINESESTQ